MEMDKIEDLKIQKKELQKQIKAEKERQAKQFVIDNPTIEGWIIRTNINSRKNKYGMNYTCSIKAYKTISYGGIKKNINIYLGNSHITRDHAKKKIYSYLEKKGICC